MPVYNMHGGTYLLPPIIVYFLAWLILSVNKSHDLGSVGPSYIISLSVCMLAKVPETEITGPCGPILDRLTFLGEYCRIYLKLGHYGYFWIFPFSLHHFYTTSQIRLTKNICQKDILLHSINLTSTTFQDHQHLSKN